MKPRGFDAFCGAGGCTKGYQRAGFEMWGCDHKPQPRYCGERFFQADALELLADLDFMAQFDFAHASPPCQAFTQMSARWRGKGTRADEHPDLLTPTRELLPATGLPYVIENVPGARNHMAATLSLHGGMFGLGVHRPRLFESNVLLLAPLSAPTKQPIGVYGTKPDGRTTYRYRNAGNYQTGEPGSASKSLIRAAKSIEEAREAMGIDWMTWDEIREAIPPAYTELIGHQLLQHLERSAA